MSLTLEDLTEAHPGWNIRRLDGEPGRPWVAVRGANADDVVRADTITTLSARLDSAALRQEKVS